MPWWFGRELDTTLSPAGAARRIFHGQVTAAVPRHGGRGTYEMKRDEPAERHDSGNIKRGWLNCADPDYIETR